MKNRRLFFICALLMIILGASDSLRGIFSPLFISEFGFSVTEVGIIVSVSYLGNLTCLLLGGVILDRIGKKKAFVIFILSLALSEAVLLSGRNYALLLIGFFLTLGISTMLNTAINLISNEFSVEKGLMFLNILFFLQGIGTVSSQFILTRYSTSIKAWNITLLSFIMVLLPLSFLFLKTEFSMEKKKKEETIGVHIGRKTYSLLLPALLSLAFYLIAEHGVTNYIMLYGTEYLDKTKETVGTALTLYSSGIMSGRLLLSPLIGKTGRKRMLLMSMALTFLSLFFVFTFDLLNLLFLTGFFCSIIYPTLVNSFKSYVPEKIEARTTTLMISAASLFDISFNALFGAAITSFGYGRSMKVIAASSFISLVFYIILLRTDSFEKTADEEKIGLER